MRTPFNGIRNYRHFSSPRRVHGVVNLGGVVKHYGVVIHYFYYRRSIFSTREGTRLRNIHILGGLALSGLKNANAKRRVF